MAVTCAQPASAARRASSVELCPKVRTWQPAHIYNLHSQCGGAIFQTTHCAIQIKFLPKGKRKGTRSRQGTTSRINLGGGEALGQNAMNPLHRQAASVEKGTFIALRMTSAYNGTSTSAYLLILQLDELVKVPCEVLLGNAPDPELN
eukprot:1139018-Pelagomonas_calceolata.AAC.10